VSRAGTLLLLAALASGCARSPSYTGVGDVVAVDAPGLRVTLRHDDIPDLMPAMTMSFAVRAADVLAGATVGTRVRFELARAEHELVVTRLTPLGAAAGPRPGVHDHTPHHGGVVAMVGMRHLEAVASPAGSVRVYLTDVWRRPLPVDRVTGAVALDLPDGRRELALTPRDAALEADGPPLGGANVLAYVRLVVDGEPVESHFVLPLGATPGAAGVAATSCTPVDVASDARGRQPRCTLRFPQKVTSIAVTPDGERAIVGTAGAGVTAWALPAGRFVVGFEAAPAVVVRATSAPHADAPTAIAVSPDGRETAMAVENRLLVYATRTGRFLREVARFRGVIDGVAWSPDGRRLLASVSYDAAAHLVDAADGRELGRLAVEREATAVAFSPDGRLAIVGSERGSIAVFTLADPTTPRVLVDSQRVINALAFAGDRLVSAGGDGVVRVWDVATGALAAAAARTGFLVHLAVAPGGRLTASAGLDHAIHLHDPTTGAEVETLAWHGSSVWGLAWAGTVLITGDGDGNVALWDLSDRRGS